MPDNDNSALPTFLLEYMKHQPSYAEGDLIPVQTPYVEPRDDPSSSQQVDEFLNHLAQARLMNQIWQNGIYAGLANGGLVGALHRDALHRHRRHQIAKSRKRRIVGALSSRRR